MNAHIIEEKIICKSHKLFLMRIFEKKIEIKTRVINMKLLFPELLNKHIFDNSNAAKNTIILSNNLTKRSF
tara:strand:- start:290 stop:502 length:213 start_codon:yes stop_codon:yes gene_type:complete